MFTLFLSFFKKYLFNGTSLFMLAFMAFIGLFIFYNSDTILERFGFETKTTIAKQLVTSQSNLETAIDTNLKLSTTIDKIEEHSKAKDIALTNTEVSKESTKKIVTTAIKKRNDTTKKADDTLAKETTINATVITIPKQMYEEASLANITLIETTYDTLFSEFEKKPTNKATQGENHA